MSTKRLIIKRYKELGEMMPEQALGNSTLDLAQVNITDVEAANDVCTVLMGDNVEPRKDTLFMYKIWISNYFI